MPSVFTPILEGAPDERVIWRDDLCVALHALEPLRPGHSLVVPVAEIDHWLDLPPEMAAHLMEVARVVGGAVQRAFRPAKVGLLIAGLKVRHVHLHLVPISSLEDLVRPSAGHVDGAAAAAAIRRELGSGGSHVHG